MKQTIKDKTEKSSTELLVLTAVVIVGGAVATASSSNILDAGASNSDGLVAEYRFDTGAGETAYDTSGNNDGSINGATWTNGVDGKALSFDGSDDTVDVSDNQVLDITGELTISAWVRNDGSNSATNWQGIVSKGGSGSGYDLNYDKSNYGLRIDGNQYFSSISPSGDWEHLTVTLIGSDLKFYKNGDLEDTVSAESLDSTNSGTLYIGRNGWNSNDVWNGDMDGVRIYSKKLNQSQVKSLYNKGSSYRIGTQESSDTSNVLDISFQHQNSSHVLDTSGYENHGDRQNGVLQDTAVNCKVGRCYSFDGNDDYVNIGDGLDFGSESFSVILWFKSSFTGFDNPNGLIKDGSGPYNSNGEGWSLRLREGSNKIEAARNNGTGTPERLGKTGLSSDRWVPVAMTYNYSSGSAKLFVNGKEVDSATSQGSYSDTHELWIARGKDGYLEGKIDQVKVFNRSLSQAEIIEKTEGLGSGGAVLDMRFDAGGGDHVEDYSTEKNHGDLKPDEATGPNQMEGVSGKALDFDGSNDYVNVGSSSSFTSKSATASVWVYPYSGHDNDSRIIYHSGSDSALILDSDSSLTVEYRGCSGWYGGNVDIPVDKWSHVTSIWDDGKDEVRIYVDGDLKSSFSMGGGCFSNSKGGIDIGAGHWTSDGQNLEAKLDNVKLYPYVLSDSRIEELNKKGKSQISSNSDSGSADLTSNLVLSQTFDRVEECGQSDTLSCPSGVSGDVAVDESGEANHGELVNGPSVKGAEDCKFGGCLRFDGDDTGLQLKDAESLNVSGEITLNAWIRPDSSDVTDSGPLNRAIIQKGFGGKGHQDTVYGMILRGENEVVGIIEDTMDQDADLSLSFSTNDEEWQMVTLEYDGSQASVYKNANLKDSQSRNLAKNSKKLYIGGDGGSRGFADEIDQVRIYNRSLSEDEIWELYTRGRDRSSEGSMAGPVAHWGFDEKKNLMNNSGFEMDEVNDNDPTYWAYPKENAWNISKDYTAPGSDGQKSFGNQWQQGPDVWPDAYVYNNFSAKPNTNYNAEFWVRLQSYSDGGWTGTKSNQQYIYEDDARLHLYFYDESGNLLQENKTRWAGDAYNRGLDYIEKNGDWFKFSQNYTSPAKTDHVRFQIDGGDNNNDYGDPETAHGGNAGIWMDDISFSFADAYDKSEDNKGVIKGASRVNGVTGNALDFDGNDDLVDTGISDNIQTSSFSVSTWMNPDTLPSNGKRLINKDPSSNGWSLSYGDPGSGKLRFFIRGKDTTSLDTAKVIEKDRWYHVTGVYDDQDKTRRIYVNGVEEASLGSDTGSPSTNSNNIALGAEADNQNNFDGTLDDVRIYPYALSHDQVKKVMNDGAVSVG